jgi:hypothetical protein
MNKQIRLEKIINMRRKGMSYGTIGNFFSISRQRVFQIEKNYKPLKEKTREFIFNRDENQCQWGEVCKNKEINKLEIHHIDGNPNNNAPNNLILLCRQCHRHFHFVIKNIEICDG